MHGDRRDIAIPRANWCNYITEGRTTMQNIWTTTESDRLKTLWAEGHSAGAISVMFLGKFTRNAVIGKVHRMDLPTRTTLRRTSPSDRRPRPKRTRQPRNVAMAKPTPRSKPMQPEAAPPPTALMLSLLDMEDHNCHWPFGDPAVSDTFGYCGVDVPDGKSYCAYHQAIAYVPHIRKSTQQIRGFRR